MSLPGDSDFTFKVYGLDHMGGEVFADVFAKKVMAIVQALKKVDRMANGGRRFEYVVAGLQMGSARIDFREKTMTEKHSKVSPAEKFLSVGAAISTGRPMIPSDDAEDEIIRTYGALSKGASKKFDYATVTNKGSDIVRVDRFLHNQVGKIIRAAQDVAEAVPTRFFVGEAIGTFDGVIQAVDLKGDAPEARLILSAGGKPIECVLFGMDLEEVRLSLGNRVAVTGRAIYEGKTGLPSRIEIRRIKRFASVDSLDLSGILRVFDYDGWGDFH